MAGAVGCCGPQRTLLPRSLKGPPREPAGDRLPVLPALRRRECRPRSPPGRGVECALRRQRARRAAHRLAGGFDWSKAETALAAEVIFSEVRGLSRPPASSDRQVATGRCVDCHYTAPLWSLTNGLRVCPSCRSHAIVEVPG